MQMWLFQLNQKDWFPRNFRCDIWENRSWHWQHRKIQSPDGTQPEPGDVIFFFYSESSGDEPGIYGWAVVDRCDDYSLYFTPTTPTNHLKIDPWWDESVRKLVDDIRGKWRQATMFQVPDGLNQVIKLGIKKWLSGGAEKKKS